MNGSSCENLLRPSIAENHLFIVLRLISNCVRRNSRQLNADGLHETGGIVAKCKVSTEMAHPLVPASDSNGLLEL